MSNNELARIIRNLAFQCHSKDVDSPEFGNEFALRVEKLLNGESEKCDWCGKEGTEENMVISKHLHESCYCDILQGEGLV